MSILEHVATAGAARPDHAGEIPGSLEVVVVHATTRETLQALQAAARMADGLEAQIRLLVLETMPYPLPVQRSQMPAEFTRNRFRTGAAGASVETRVELVLGRDLGAMLESALRSLIVARRTSRMVPAFRRRLARRLERQGHHVVFSAAR